MRLVQGLVRHAPRQLNRYRFPRVAESLLGPFHDKGLPTVTAYEGLVRYFVTGWSHYRTSAGTGVAYPGYPSRRGHEIDRLEGFARLMPLFGAWCQGGRSSTLTTAEGHSFEIPEVFAHGLVAGTNPSADGYWGDIVANDDQRIVEAADVALALWLFRDTVWKGLPLEAKGAVVHWLSSVEDRTGVDNNWQLFFVLIDRVLESLGVRDAVPSSRSRYERVLEFHLGGGWFADGPSGHIDYYNAWGFHYLLDWIDRIDPNWDPTVIHSYQRQFLTTFRYLVGPEGFPILGRSIPYRLAISAPLVAGSRRHPDVISSGEARRALDTSWQYFIRSGAIRDGTISQGYFGPDLRLVDHYSGPGSSLWSLRSLVNAFCEPDDGRFWSAPSPLLVERSNYDVTLEVPRWRITGEQISGRICVEMLDNDPFTASKLKSVSLRDRIRSIALDQPFRPANEEAKYSRRVYCSEPPFWRDSV